MSGTDRWCMKGEAVLSWANVEQITVERVELLDVEQDKSSLIKVSMTSH